MRQVCARDRPAHGVRFLVEVGVIPACAARAGEELGAIASHESSTPTRPFRNNACPPWRGSRCAAVRLRSGSRYSATLASSPCLFLAVGWDDRCCGPCVARVVGLMSIRHGAARSSSRATRNPVLYILGTRTCRVNANLPRLAHFYRAGQPFFTSELSSRIYLTVVSSAVSDTASGAKHAPCSWAGVGPAKYGDSLKGVLPWPNRRRTESATEPFGADQSLGFCALRSHRRPVQWKQRLAASLALSQAASPRDAVGCDFVSRSYTQRTHARTRARWQAHDILTLGLLWKCLKPFIKGEPQTPSQPLVWAAHIFSLRWVAVPTTCPIDRASVSCRFSPRAVEQLSKVCFGARVGGSSVQAARSILACVCRRP